MMRIEHGSRDILGWFFLGFFAIASERALAGEDMDAAVLWQAIAEGSHVALLRHAYAPGTGDPAGFALDDCTTQRNLSDEGRKQARKIGQRFREHGIRTAEVFTSQWCRCRETAQGLGIGPATDLPVLNSFFADMSLAGEATRRLASWLAMRTSEKPLVLVTHQVNITGLTGIVPGSGEVIVFRQEEAGTISVLGRIPTPY